MKHVIVKGDDYEMTSPGFVDNYDDPETKQRPAGGDSREGIVKITKSNSPDTGEEFVFCKGKPVVTVGYVFSKLTKDTFKREWPPQEPDDPSMTPAQREQKKKKEEQYTESKQSSDVYSITASNALDFVFIDGVPVCCEDKISATMKKEVVIDGEVQEVESKEGEGEFVLYTGHVYGD